MDAEAANISQPVRSFRKGDLPECSRLYREGLIGGKLAENDTGLDIDDIEFGLHESRRQSLLGG